ncbi:MAG: diguanylate cyclase, partial [Pseudomonadales bacterium]
MISSHFTQAPGASLRASRLLRHWTFLGTIFLGLSVWMWDPILDTFLSGEALRHSDFFQPDDAEISKRILLSCVIFILGSFVSYLYMRLLVGQQHLLENQQLLTTIIDSEPECVKSVSLDGKLLSMNPAGLAILEVNDFADIEGAEVIELVAPDHRETFQAFHERVIQGANEQLEFDILTTTGTRKTLHSHAVPLRNVSGEITAHLSITRDITKTKALNDKLRYQATHDQITSLVNRGEFEFQLAGCIGRAAAKKCTHAVLFMDLDQFKVINDTCGHLAGDALLKKIGQLLTKQVRQQDTVARLGGDEFALLLEYCSADDAPVHANKIRTSIEAMDFYWNDRIFKTTASIGVVIVDETTSSVTE